MGNTFAAIPVTSADGLFCLSRLFSGKELTTAMSLNEYDFHARSLTLFGSFTAPDPLAGSQTDPAGGERLSIPYISWLSPYAYCASDPINFTDPTGMWTLENKDRLIESKVLCIFPEFTQMDDAIFHDWEAAHDAKMPILHVSNVEDLKDAYSNNSFLHALSVVTVNSHGNVGLFFIGNESITENSNLEQLQEVFQDKTIFIGACKVGALDDGANFTQLFSEKVRCTVITSEHALVSGYDYSTDKSLNYGRPLISYGNCYQLSSYGSEPRRIFDVQITKSGGNLWLFIMNQDYVK